MLRFQTIGNIVSARTWVFKCTVESLVVEVTVWETSWSNKRPDVQKLERLVSERGECSETYHNNPAGRDLDPCGSHASANIDAGGVGAASTL